MGPRIDPYLSPTRSKLVRDYNDSPPHAERVSVCDLPPLSCWFAVTSRPYPVRSWLFAVTSCPYPALSWPRLALFREESTALSLRAAAILLGNLPPVVRVSIRYAMSDLTGFILFCVLRMQHFVYWSLCA